MGELNRAAAPAPQPAAAPEPASMPRVFDMHCHLDFDPDPAAAAATAQACGLGAFSATVEPQAFEPAEASFAGNLGVRAGLGLHPWWVEEGPCGEDQLAAFECLAPGAHLVGEVGLDFGPRHVQLAEAQLDAFERIAVACEGGGKVLSIHAVRSASQVLDVLERHGVTQSCACIFHWFSGSSDELQRAARLGCFFSVNPRMLETKRGRSYIRAIPEDRLLLETDLPEDAGMSYDAPAVVERLDLMTAEMAELRAAPADELGARIAETSRRLLAL